MRRRVAVLSVLAALMAASCGGAAETASTNPSASDPVEPGETTTTPLTEAPSSTTTTFVSDSQAPSERSPHVRMPDGTQTSYLHREFLQNPAGAIVGPDDALYIADFAGRHVVKVTAGTRGDTFEDLGIWKVNPGIWAAHGPRDVAFDSAGTLYVSDHRYVWRIESDGRAVRLDGVGDRLVGGIAFGPDDTLYYTDRSSDGGVYAWSPEGVHWVGNDAAGNRRAIPDAEDIVVASDGTIYVSQMARDRIVRLDAETGVVSEFASGGLGWDPIYLAIDPDGDVWARGISVVKQFSSDGSEITVQWPFPPTWSTAAGIAISSSGRVWVASYDSRLLRFDPRAGAPGEYDPWLSHPAFSPSGLATGPDGRIVAFVPDTGELWTFSGDSARSVEFPDLAGPGRTVVAVGDEGLVYLGLPGGSVVSVDDDRHVEQVAPFLTRSMVVGSDGLLYLVDARSSPKVILRIAGNAAELVADTLGGSQMLGEVHIAAAPGGGLFAFDESSAKAYSIDPQGDSVEIADLSDRGGSGPAAFTAGPLGEMYVLLHGPYAVYRVDSDGTVSSIADSVFGDPLAMAVSPDGSTLYVAEAGAIDVIPLGG